MSDRERIARLEFFIWVSLFGNCGLLGAVLYLFGYR